MSIYADWGLTPIINASGAVTRLGGAPMPTAVLSAFQDAALECVSLDALQGLASRQIAAATGAEAGLVTSGASAALLLGTAAILTGNELGRMERLPDCSGFPAEFVLAREHRNGYDHAVRAAGAKFVEVGFHEPIAGAGVRRVEAWEYAAAFGSQTAGILYVHQAGSQPPLREIVDIAHERGLPVLVDAAGELPPRSNLGDILATGADLVCFSGGKAIRGPQATGILCGRRHLVGSAAMQMLDMDDHFALWDPPPELIDKSQFRGIPRQGIGRSMKVSKEQIMALLTALKLFVSGAYQAEIVQQRQWLEQIATSVAGETAGCRLIEPSNPECLPTLAVKVDEHRLRRSALEVCHRLRKGTPPVYVGHWALHESELIINPLHLNAERAAILAQRLAEELMAG